MFRTSLGHLFGWPRFNDLPVIGIGPLRAESGASHQFYIWPTARHCIELDCARVIAEALGVKQHILDLSLMAQITHNALMDAEASIKTPPMAHQTPWWMGATPYS